VCIINVHVLFILYVFFFSFLFLVCGRRIDMCCVQQVKVWYIYILGVKRLDFIIKSWITRKLLSFSQSGRLESPKSRLLIIKWEDRLTNKSFLNLSYREHFREPIHLICIFLFFSFFGMWEKNWYVLRHLFSDPYVCTIVITNAIYSINIAYTNAGNVEP
jgi:hypothetical protein